MAKNKIKAPTFDEILFEFRNKEYGAYVIRKKYNKYMTISLTIGIILICTFLILPYLQAKAAYERGEARAEREVTIEMENLELPDTDFAPPPPPPPPPPEEAVQQQRYVPPVVVEELDLEEEGMMTFMTFDEIREEIVDRAVDEVIEIVAATSTIEVQNDLDEVPQFVVVEEMPMFPGGESALMSFLNSNVVYPERAKENGLQGTVYLRFVVTSRGNIGEVQLLRGVDPILDAAAMEVVRKLPAFRPGRQGGTPVAVWYQVPITFRLLEVN